MPPHLAKRKIAAQDGEPGLGECGCHGNEERRLAVRAGAVREDESVARQIVRAMHETANGRLGVELKRRPVHSLIRPIKAVASTSSITSARTPPESSRP